MAYRIKFTCTRVSGHWSTDTCSCPTIAVAKQRAFRLATDLLRGVDERGEHTMGLVEAEIYRADKLLWGLAVTHDNKQIPMWVRLS